MRKYIAQICAELTFPEEAVQTMLDAWDKIMACPASGTYFEQWLAAYEKDIHMNYEAALLDMDKAAEAAGVHKYTAELLFFLCLSRHLREIYRVQGMDTVIFHDSCMDMKWKLMECQKMYGIWGSFVAFWFPGFFEMTRFALGRLQFELINFPKSYEAAGRKRPSGMTKVINVHIPSCGKLRMEDCHESYRRASEFFADAFAGDEVAFYCESWMLYSPHREFLKPDSGVVSFMKEYDIYRTGQEDGDLWRIFNRMYEGNPDVLAEETSMQRAYKAWLKAGNHAGFGEGIFFMRRA